MNDAAIGGGEPIPPAQDLVQFEAWLLKVCGQDCEPAEVVEATAIVEAYRITKRWPMPGGDDET